MTNKTVSVKIKTLLILGLLMSCIICSDNLINNYWLMMIGSAQGADYNNEFIRE